MSGRGNGSRQATSAGCPSPQRLSDFLYGQLPAADLGAMTAHLGECRLCQARLGELDDSQNDPLSEQSEASHSSFWSLGAAPDAGPMPDKSHFLHMLSDLGKKCGLDLPTSWRGSLEAKVEPSAPPAPSVERVIPLQLGQYQLLDVIGEGGMGIVYRAQHVVMKRERALKLLHPSRVASSADLARFYREIEAVARLEHPNIVVGHDAQEALGHHFLVMEYVRGMNLSRLLAALGPLPVPDACELVRQAAVGLDYAHTHGLVHRDIKPSNLLLSDRGVVKLLDLGLASQHSDNSEEDERDVVLGTADYISPEQWRSADRVDGRADIYSLGCTLYQLLVGRPPFGDLPESHRVKAEAHCQRVPAAVTAARDDVPTALESLVDRMLAKARDDRPGSAAEVAVALSRLNAGHDLTALLERCGHEISDTRRIPRANLSTLISRRIQNTRVSRRAILGAGAVGVLSVGGLAAWFWPQWNAASELLPNPQKAHWLQRSDGDQIEITADKGFTLTAGPQLALLRLATLPAGNYRLSTTITLEPKTRRAGLYFDFGGSNSPAAQKSAQSLGFEVNQRGRYSLVWRHMMLQPDDLDGINNPPFGDFMAGQPLTLEVEWTSAGIAAVWCNQKAVPSESFRATEFSPQGIAGLILMDGTAHFTPVMVRRRN